MLTRFHQIARDVYVHPVGFAGFQIVEIQRAELFVDDGAIACGRGLQIQALILQHLLHLLRARVVGKERDGAVAVREEIDFVADPHGVVIVRTIARDLFSVAIG